MIYCEFEDLCKWDIDTRRLRPILDPLTIITNIISNDEIDHVDIVSIKEVNNDIISISKLNNIKIIFFRHQHILSILIIIMINIKFIFRFSTSKVDILLNYLELLLVLIVILGILFIIRMQPIFMVRRLILIILMYSYIIYIIIGGYWFRYALIIVILRGVLVVFTYIVRLVPNERFENYNLIYMVGIILVMERGFYIWIYDYKFGIISLELWVRIFSIFNIFIIRFLLIIILIVVWFSYIGCGALKVNW